jgi:surface antigen
MRKAISILVITALLPISSPAYADGVDTVFGTIVGGILGGLVGSQFGHGSGRDAAIAVAALFGAVAGNRVGASLDREGSPAVKNSSGGSGNGSSTRIRLFDGPMPTVQYRPNYVAPPAPDPNSFGYYDANAGIYCRQILQPVLAGNRVRQVPSTACMQPDGSMVVLQ